MLEEMLEYFGAIEMRTFVDGTLGAGGHALAILESPSELECLVGIDQDPLARSLSAERLEMFSSKVRIIEGNYRDMKDLTADLGLTQVDGIFLDIGVSSMQLDRAEKGFSFRRDGPLDMRMDPDNPLTAEEIVNSWPEKELQKLIRDYGEENKWRQISQGIVEKRKHMRIQRTSELADLIQEISPPFPGQRTHPATKVFQALRIVVNGELDALEKGLHQAIDLLSPGGRLGVITFHSLEDRIVKTVFREKSGRGQVVGFGTDAELNRQKLVKVLTKKPLLPSLKEQKVNRRSRSAKLRFVEKL